MLKICPEPADEFFNLITEAKAVDISKLLSSSPKTGYQ
jgi:hypothetical protein